MNSTTGSRCLEMGTALRQSIALCTVQSAQITVFYSSIISASEKQNRFQRAVRLTSTKKNQFQRKKNTSFELSDRDLHIKTPATFQTYRRTDDAIIGILLCSHATMNFSMTHRSTRAFLFAFRSVALHCAAHAANTSMKRKRNQMKKIINLRKHKEAHKKVKSLDRCVYVKLVARTYSKSS